MFVFRVASDLTVVELQNLTHATTGFGYHVGMTDTLLVVGCYDLNANQGGAFVYARASSAADYIFKQSLLPLATLNLATSFYGFDVAICDNNYIAVSAPEELSVRLGVTITAGAVHVFKRNSGTGNYVELADMPITTYNPDGDDWFGRSIACVDTTLVIGADQDNHDDMIQVFNTGSVSVLHRGSDDKFTLVSKLFGRTAGDRLGWGAAMKDSSTIVVGAVAADNNRGLVYLIERVSSTAYNITQTWAPGAGVVASGSVALGRDVAISSDNVIVGGAFLDGSGSTGSVLVFA